MIEIPEVTAADAAFGNIKHLPKYDTLPDDFKRHNGNDYCRAISEWFFGGVASIPNGIEANGMKFVAKDGVDAKKALRAIGTCMRSWEPKHEHKEAGCAYLLAEWFDKVEAKKAA